MSFRLQNNNYMLFLFGHTNSLAGMTGGCCVLTSDTETPVMTKTAMSFDFLQAFQIFTQFILQSVSQNLRIFSVLDIFRSVQEIIRNLILTRILHNGDQSLNLII